MDVDTSHLELVDLSPHGFQAQAAIGQGRFGQVVSAISLATRNRCAIKLLPRGSVIEDGSVYTQREIVNHATMKHPFIIQLNQVFLSASHLCLVMELGEMNLAQYCETQPGSRLSEPTARHVMRQLLVGLDYMHRIGVANRDLKLENVLICYQDSNIVTKLSDFGYSKAAKHSTARSGVGTVGYTAPEVIIGGIAYDAPTTDIWSLGVMLYVMITGKFPFDVQSRTWSQDVMRGAFAPLDDGLHLSEGLLHLLSRMLEPSPRKRAKMAELMQHEWVVEGLGGYRLEDGMQYTARLELEPGVEKKIDELVRRAAWPQDAQELQGIGSPDEDLRCVFNET